MKYNPQETEKSILKFWEEYQIYQKVKEKVQSGKVYYFLDGPPYTSGKVHIGTAWNKSLKDMVLRYKRMKGFNVWDRAGYDMHGLPTAHKVEEKLGIKHKDEIPKFGIQKFVEECRKLAVDNMEAMNKTFKSIGVWMNFDNAYTPITKEFMEGEWWLIKKAHENQRLYEGEKVMHWCSSCATSLAKHELEYENVTDESIFLKLKVKGAEKSKISGTTDRGTENEFLVIWTTTPWTIAYNLGVMVNPEQDYVKAKVGDEIWIVAKALVTSFVSAVVGKEFRIIEEFKGEKLQGVEYVHPYYNTLKDIYDKLKEKSPNVHTVFLSEEYVDTSSGSGLVHCAPGCGPEDYEVGREYGVLPFNNLDEFGNYPEEMKEFAGLNAKKDNKKFIEKLDELGALIATNPVEHEYAHCWRCKSPVIFRTTKQWFFKVEDMKDKMRALNKDIEWIPDWAGSNWFDSWLNNLRDNGITRQRYWGTPLPIWKCKKCKEYVVIGSLNELKELAGNVPDDLHRPYIDEVKIPCSCGEQMDRIPDILDVWIDAGTTSWTCLDYPQKTELFDKMWPPDFILEGKDQIRGWFNLLLIASMVSIGKPSYKACYMHGFVQDSQGRKMSKSLGNYILPEEVLDKYGADTLRYYMIGGANPGVDINYNFEDMNVKHKNLMVLWNLGNYLIDYSKTLGINPSEVSEDILGTEEKYILSKLNSTMQKVTELFENYHLNDVPLAIEELYLDLSRTYIQLTREKSALGSKDDKKVVLNTIYKVLINVLKMFSPVAPFITEAMYQNLKDAFKLHEFSIHMFDWPVVDEKAIDRNLELAMDTVSNVVQSSLAGRDKMSLGVRWPIQSLTVATKDDMVSKAVIELKEIIKTQVNVKEINVLDDMPGVKLNVQANFKTLGPDFGQAVAMIIPKLTQESPETILGHIEKEGKFTLKIDGRNYDIKKDHITVERDAPTKYQESEFKAGFVYLDKTMSDELEAEGYAREVMRRVQVLRKTGGLEKKDSIILYIKSDSEGVEMLSKHEDLIAEKVGAEKIKIDKVDPVKKHENNSKENIKGKEFEIWLDKVIVK